MKIGNLGKSALVGLGLSCGVGDTPLIRMNRTSNETSLLSGRNFKGENVITSVDPNQDNNTAREIDIVESHTTNLENNCNKVEDNVINKQKNTNQKGLHSTKSIIKDDMQTAPPSYEEVVGCSNDLEDVEEDIADIINL